MKKVNIFIMSMLIFTTVALPSFAFTDTTEHWANDVIEEMNNYKIINGYEDDTFRPDEIMTRAEFVTVVNRILALDEESSKYIPDVNRTDWFYSEIRKAVKIGIIQGNTDGYIFPNDEITREEAIVILTRAFKMNQTTRKPQDFTDLSEISKWAESEMYSAISQGILNGYNDNTIRPKASITRAEALTLIDRILPNILKTNVYQGLLTGNVVLCDDNIVLNNLTIDGNLIISNNALKTLTVKDVTVKKNVIINDKNHEFIKKIKIMGDVFEFSSEKEELNGYLNEEFGISFAVPNSATVKLFSGDSKIDYKIEDLIVIDVIQNDEFYMKSINTIAKLEIAKYDYLYKEVEDGVIGKDFKYILFSDRTGKQMLVIKRDNIAYVLRFYNIESDNLVDNVLSTMEFFETENIVDTKNIVYKNSKLSLKFTYKDKYVVVDDSYNTNIINEDKKFFKLFIQVNTITDIQEYNLNEIKLLLSSIVSKEGDIKETETFKIMNNNAIKFKTEADGKITYSLYVVIGNNLYNLIFKGEENGMSEVGEELFDDIVDSLEF
ncbi:MAG: S-layer homology domain-containing protein [Clostridia bacterium]|nr:S-layer homology domain-containing protein [Clostridia bacterium]